MAPRRTVLPLLKAVTKKYLESGDFNGLPVAESMSTEVVIDLIRRGLLSLNRGDRHPNPHVLAFPAESAEVQISKIEKEGMIGCLYPTAAHLAIVVKPRAYEGRPFSLCLAFGEAQLSFKSFDLSVLEHYRNDPRYSFTVGDVEGSLGVKDDYYDGGSESGIKRAGAMRRRDQSVLQTFGFAYDKEFNRAVAVYLRYLHDLTPEHQRVWEARLLDGKWILHPEYALTSSGHWPEKYPILMAFTEELHQINLMCGLMGRESLFKKEFQHAERPREFMYLLRPTLRAFNEFVHVLDKMLSENIDNGFFGGIRPVKPSPPPSGQSVASVR